MPYRVELTASAVREIKSLDRSIQRRIGARIDELAANPLPPGAKKLQGQPGHYRIQVGDYRVIYRIEKKIVTIVVVKIGHSREIYR